MDATLNAFMQPVYADTASDIKNLVESTERPLLAHYTSIDSLEKILRSGEVWLSNPFFMNDLQEIRAGMKCATDLFVGSQAIDAACGSEQRARILKEAYFHYIANFEAKHLLDVYVFCVSEHDQADKDGRLSMWRGYGGNGGGAALIFHTAFVARNDNSPLLLVKVKYLSDADRISWTERKLEIFCNVLRGLSVPDNELYKVAFAYFEFAKYAALATKHIGFEEEREWRMIYMPDRDATGLMKERFGYVVGQHGVEPKLKFPVKPLDTSGAATWTFSEIIDRIILGPTAAKPLASESLRRMLDQVGRPELRDKLTISTIPLRPVSH